MSLAASAYVHTVLGYATSFVLGTLIGLERQWRQRTAGLRTNVLVAVGASAFSDLGFRLLGMDGATRIIAYVVSGIGFLGARCRMRRLPSTMRPPRSATHHLTRRRRGPWPRDRRVIWRVSRPRDRCAG